MNMTTTITPHAFDPSLKASFRDMFAVGGPWGGVTFPPTGGGRPLRTNKTFMGIVLTQADNDYLHDILSMAASPVTAFNDTTYEAVAQAIRSVLPDAAATEFSLRFYRQTPIAVSAGDAGWVPSGLLISLVDGTNGTADHVAIEQSCIALP